MAEPERGPWLDFQPPAQTDGPWTLYQNQSRNFGIDFTRPIGEVRAAIGRLPDADRPEALRQWAEAYVGRERQPSGRGTAERVVREVARFTPIGALAEIAGYGIGNDARTDLARNVGRGTAAGPWLDEARAGIASLGNALTGRGMSYDEAVAVERARDRAIDRDRPVSGAVAQIAGALAGGGGAFQAARAFRLPNPMAGGLFRQTAAAIPIGAVHAANYAAGVSEGTPEERLAAGAAAAPVGAILGGLAPPVLRGGNALVRPVVDWASPTLARVGANIRDTPRRIGLHFSADGAPPDTAGAVAAAEQVIANALLNAGVPRTRIREMLDRATADTRFWSSGRAQDATVLADTERALQRLASSLSRNSPEAANIMEPFLRSRQTGIASAEEAGQLAARGLPTREAMAIRRRDDDPAGQMERVRDAFRRSMLIEDQAFHGHLGTGRRTEQAIVEASRREADELYDAAYRAGETVDLTPAIAPVFRKWSDTIAQAPAGLARELQRAMRNFFTRDGQMVTNLRRFQEAKEFLDDQIGKLMRSGDRRLAGMLTEMQRELLAAVDSLPGVGTAYQTARNTFAGRMQMRDALEMGRQAFREQSEIGADAFRALTTEGERKLFRLGLLDSYTDAAARMKSGADRLGLFDNPRIRDILSEVIPRRGTFDNPRTFGRYLEDEARMIATRNEVVGNSKTAQRLADDDRYRALSTLQEVFQSGGTTQAALRAIEKAAQAVFGMRQDTAAAIARQLFNANPTERMRILERIESRMGSSRMEALARYLQTNQAALAGATARGVTGATSGP